MSKYKNTTEHDLVIPGVGIVEAGGVIETNELLENPNLEVVELSTVSEGEIVSGSPVTPQVTAPVAPVQISAPNTEIK